MKPLRDVLTCLIFFMIGCEESKNPTPPNGSDVPAKSNRVYRCEWSPILDDKAEDPFEGLENAVWRATLDGVCIDQKVYVNLTKVIASLPDYTVQDFPFVGYCEHYLLSDGSSKGILIGFVCENYGIVVWEAETDEQGRWYKTDFGRM